MKALSESYPAPIQNLESPSGEGRCVLPPPQTLGDVHIAPTFGLAASDAALIRSPW